MICPLCDAQYAGDVQVCPVDGTQLFPSSVPGALDESIEHPVESTLLDTLRTDPADVATRQVYADWLEEHGYETRASFLRLDAVDDHLRDDHTLHELALPTDAAWRAIISRAPIAKCVAFTFACPKRWDALAPTGKDDVRHCGSCNKPVYFCRTVDQARAHGAKRECVAVDAALTRADAEAAYNATAGIPPPQDFGAVMGIMMPPPPHIVMGAPLPPPPPPKRGVLARIKGWFGR